MNKEYMKTFVKDRNEAALSLDREIILRYMDKYGIEAPENEEAFWAGIHKARLQITAMPESEKELSRQWLREHGFKEEISFGPLADTERNQVKYTEILNSMRVTAFVNRWDGTPENFERLHPICRKLLPGITNPDLLISVLLTYDYDYDAFDNGQKNECLHLSLSVAGKRVKDDFKMLPAPGKLTKEELHAWAEAVFAPLGPDVLNWLFIEHGWNVKSVEHLRLFYSKETGQPILPTSKGSGLEPYAYVGLG